ncbi:MAG TPA: ABC transporter permease, partial [Acidimicrobiales bacterium]
MGRLVTAKLLHLAVVLWLVSLATFLMLELVPGDPAAAVLGTSGTPEQYARVRAEMGVDDPIVARYVDWLGDAVRGDLGHSVTPPYDNVLDSIRARLPVTLEIAALGLAASLGASIPLAMWSAHRAGERFDRACSAATFALLALPSFLAGLLLIQLFVFHTTAARALIAIAGALCAVLLLHRVRTDRDTPLIRRLLPGTVAVVVTVAL